MKSLVAIAKGAPFLLIGLFLCATIELFPIGIVLILCSCIPLVKVQQASIRAEVAKEMEGLKSKPYKSDEPIPGWVIEGLPSNAKDEFPDKN